MEPIKMLCDIIAADEKARAALDEAAQRRENAATDAARLRRDEEKKAMAQAGELAELARREALRASADALAALAAAQEKDQARIRDSWAERRDACVERIFRAAVLLDD